ncbi:hypothetical protein L6164_024685 [Bauhinia variegata]|uniref:Uncharacterized protein n=1 Tax=Bauhinia variegata TaxID=167791 RepID=A0ACB9LYE4_BAUVA|nr:hypothetical protein L6164_024685 [Bauhinia variegata]
MANSKRGCIIIIVVTLTFSYGIFSALGRPLKAESEENVTTSVKEMTIVGNNSVHWHRPSLQNEAPSELTTGQDSQNPSDNDAVGRWTDDFRPTTPGHSPGAGHSHPPAKTDSTP